MNNSRISIGHHFLSYILIAFGDIGDDIHSICIVLS